MRSHSSDNIAFIPVGIIQRTNLDSETHTAYMCNWAAFSWRAFRDGLQRAVVNLCLFWRLKKHTQDIIIIALDVF